MKFIFPQNYNFKNKLWGMIDYTTILANIIWYFLIFILVNIFFHSINLKIVIFILFCFPLFLFSISGLNGENVITVLTYLIKFIAKQKLYFYGKKHNRK